MDIAKALFFIRTVGLRAAARTGLYALSRDALERAHRSGPASGPAVLPGRLQEVEALADGGRFHFEAADLEIRFLAPDLIRLDWGSGLQPIPYAIARTDWPPPTITAREATDGWLLSSDAVELIVRANGNVLFGNLERHILRHDLPPQRQGESWVHRARVQPDEHFYGLGERAAPPNLRSGSYRMWNRDPGGAYGPGVDPIYLTVPAYVGLHGNGGYLVWYENSFDGTFTFDETVEARFEAGALRYYFVPGPLARAVERFTELTGRPPLPPRWAFGYHQSRWGYKSESDIREVVAGFRAHDLPLSAIHLDIDYMDGYRVFTVDASRYPDLARLAHDLDAQGVRLVTILDPGVKRDPKYPVFSDGLEADAFCKLPDGRPVYGLVWPDWSAFPDFTDPKARSWWGRYYAYLLDAGVAGFWHDMNEPTAFAAWGDVTLPRPVRHAFEGRGGDHREAHNLYGLLMAKAGHDALRRHRPDRRPFILTRSGWTGLQRYAWNWTGDTESTWESLRQTVATILGLGLSGIPFVGPDIGGFSGSPSAELYLRWFQLATFLPFFRGHAALGTARREPWVFGEPYTGIVREFLKLRYRLIPYFYTLAWEAVHTGYPLVRPPFWPDGQDYGLWDEGDTFLLGDSLLVAPVVEAAAVKRKVTLPKGHWYSFWDDALIAGPGQLDVEVSLDRIPLYVCAGTVLPAEDLSQRRLVLHLYVPPEGQGDGLLYSDGGDGYGPSRLDLFRVKRYGEGLDLSWESEGEYPFPYSVVELRLHGMTARRASVDGAQVPCDGDRLELKGPFARLRFTN